MVGMPGMRPPDGRRDESIESLVEAARRSRSRTTLDALWRAVFRLPSWHLPARGSGTALRPLVTTIDGHPFVLASTADLARPALSTASPPAALSGPRTPEATTSGPEAASALTALTLVPWVAVALAEQLIDEGVYGILFDEGRAGFYAPLPALVDMSAYFGCGGGAGGGTGPTCFCGVRGVDFDRALREVPAGRRLPARVLSLLFTQPEWWFVCDPDRPDAVAVAPRRGARSVLGFTDDWQALRGIEQHDLVGADDAVMLLQLRVPDAVAWLAGLRSPDVGHVTFNAGGRAFDLPIDRLPDLLARHGS